MQSKQVQLELAEFLEASGQVLKPSRTIAPATLIFGIGIFFIGSMSFLFVNASDTNAKSRPLLWFGAAVAVAGMLLWRWDGRRSRRSMETNFRTRFRDYLVPGEFSLQTDGWAITRDGAVDVRKFEALKSWSETTTAIVLQTNTSHFLPKRVFTADELNELRSRLPRAKFEDSAGLVALSTWDFMVAAADYTLHRQRATFFGYLLTPAVVAILVLFYANGDQAMMHAFPSIMRVEVTGILLAYPAMFIFIFLKCRKHAQAAGFTLGEPSFHYRNRRGCTSHNWSSLLEGFEGTTAIYFVPSLNHYYFFPKRSLTPEQVTFLLSKVSLLKEKR